MCVGVTWRVAERKGRSGRWVGGAGGGAGGRDGASTTYVTRRAGDEEMATSLMHVLLPFSAIRQPPSQLSSLMPSPSPPPLRPAGP